MIILVSWCLGGKIRGKEMADKKQKSDISKMSFEDAIKELTSIVSKIEQGQIPLQDSLEQYERGMALIKHCRGILQQAEKRIEKIAEEEETGDRRQ
jgi:exodeoxyribonuclease VII small subunit